MPSTVRWVRSSAKNDSVDPACSKMPKNDRQPKNSTAIASTRFFSSRSTATAWYMIRNTATATSARPTPKQSATTALSSGMPLAVRSARLIDRPDTNEYGHCVRHSANARVIAAVAATMSHTLLGTGLRSATAGRGAGSRPAAPRCLRMSW